MLKISPKYVWKYRSSLVTVRCQRSRLKQPWVIYVNRREVLISLFLTDSHKMDYVITVYTFQNYYLTWCCQVLSYKIRDKYGMGWSKYSLEVFPQSFGVSKKLLSSNLPLSLNYIVRLFCSKRLNFSNSASAIDKCAFAVV